MRYAILTAAFAAAAGCSSGPTLAPVSGRVTVGGKPVTAGRIEFYPEAGRMATAAIRPDGTYTLTTFDAGDGAVVGRHRVAIRAVEFKADAGQPAPKSVQEEATLSGSGGAAGEVVWLVPQRYSEQDTSDLTADVASEPNVINFDLP